MAGRKALHPRGGEVSRSRFGPPREANRLERLQDAFVLRPGLSAKGDVAIGEAFEAVIADWRRQAEARTICSTTITTHARVMAIFERFLSSRGVERVYDITSEHLVDFQEALTTDKQEPPTISTMQLRRSVVRAFYTTAACLGITDVDLTGAMARFGKPDRVNRPLTDHELNLLKNAAEAGTRGELGSIKTPAAVALAILGAASQEIPQVTVSDVDILESRVWVRGSGDRIRARWLPIDDDWCYRVLLERVNHIRQQDQGGASNVTIAYSLGTYRGGKFQKNPAAATTNLIDKTLKAAGVKDSRYVRVASITEALALRIFAETGRLEAVATRLGMFSLDRVAEMVQHDWVAQFRFGPQDRT